MALFLGVIKNNWQLALLVFVLIGGFGWVESIRIERDHYKSAAATAEKNLATKMAADATQEKLNEENAQTAAAAAQQTADQLRSALDANRLTGNALTASVQQYELQKGRCAVRSGESAGGNARHLPGGSAATTAGRIDSELAIIPADAQAVITQLRACQATLKEITHGGSNSSTGASPTP